MLIISQVIKAEGQLVDLIQRISLKSFEERIILNNNDSDAPVKNLVNIVVNNWLPTRFHRNATMDIKIMKAIKIVNEQKVARQKEEDREVYRRSTDQKILRNIINLKIQTNNLQHDLSSIKRHLNI